MQKRLIGLLLFEIVVVIVVGFVFRFIEPRIHAAYIAGSLFVLVGASVFAFGIVNRAFRWRPTFVFGCMHLFLVALPMLITRAIYADLKFEEVKVLGLPGPTFHRLSTWIYLALMIATVIDIIHARRNKKASS